MKVSVIIPVYNVEDYLDKCLKSVEEQTYKDYEIIIVNDGSPDNSQRIIDEYTARNKNFVSYTIENRGQGGARNFGLEKATGEYVVFLDSDDYVSSDCLEKFVLAAEKNDSDIVVCNNYDVDENGNIIRESKNNVQDKTTSADECPKVLLNRPCPWGKMYRKTLFDGLSFVSRVWYEDMRLTPKLFLRAKKITFIDDFLFYYVQRQGSTMNNSQALRNLEIIDAFEDLISYFKENDAYDKYKSELDYMLIDNIAVAAVTRVVLSNAKEKKTVIKKLQDYMSGFENVYDNKYICDLGRNKRLILAFNRRKLYFLTALCMKLKSKMG